MTSSWGEFVLAITAIVWAALFLTAGLVLLTWMFGKIADMAERIADKYRARRILR